MAITGRGSYPLASTWFRKKLKSSLSPLAKVVYTDDTDSTEVTIFNDWFFQASSPSTTYTLTAQSGVYNVTGQSINLYRNRSLSLSSGLYTLVGQSATVWHHRVLVAQGGNYSYTGQSVDITYIPSSAVYTLTVQSGTYTLSGQSAVISRHRYLSASSGSYLITGQDVSIFKHRLLSASSGTYTFTGQSAVITWSMVGGAVWPVPSQVLLGTVYGPTGSEYTGTLDVLGIKYDISTGQLVKPINDKVVMTL